MLSLNIPFLFGAGMLFLSDEKFCLWFDGASRGNPGEAGVGVVIKKLTEDIHIELGAYLGKRTNNEAEYHALLIGVQEALVFNPQALEIYSDSELVVRQILGLYKVRKQELIKLHREATGLLVKIPRWKMHHIPRNQNQTADMLANRAIDGKEKEKKYWIRRVSKEEAK